MRSSEGDGRRPLSIGLAVRRSYVIDDERTQAVVVEVDATAQPPALAVLQAPLAEHPEGQRLIFGFDIGPAGLAALGDARVRLKVWPALVDERGEITEDDPTDPDRDLLVIDFDPDVDADAIASVIRFGRVIIAGPEAGPTPLVVDLDRDRFREVAEQLGRQP